MTINKQNFSLIQRGLVNVDIFVVKSQEKDRTKTKVDVECLCELLDIRLIPTNDPDKLRDSLTGKVELAGLEITLRGGKATTTIYYQTPKSNIIDNDTRSNIAHEIAHFLIHKDKMPIIDSSFKIRQKNIVDFSITKKIAKTSNWKNLPVECEVMEAEADTLGSFILIPYTNLIGLYKTDKFNIDYVSQVFGTSKRFAQERIKYFEYTQDFRANQFDKNKFNNPPEEFFNLKG